MHGWGGSNLSFKCVSDRIKDHCCIRIDFPGFGAEPPPRFAFGVEDYASWLHEKLQCLGVTGKIVLVGHSFGGRVAIVYAAKYSKCVEKIVLVDSAGIKPKFKINKAIKIIWFRFCKKCAKIGLYSKEKLAMHGSNDWKNLPENMKGTFIKVINQDLSGFAKQVFIPTLIVWGKNDYDTPLYMANKLHKLMTGSKLFVFDDAGHYSYIDKLHEFIDLLNNFL